MTSIANGELGLSVRAKLNDLLTASDALTLAVTDAQTAASDAELAAASASATAAALTGFDLAAIAASKSITAVDGFVYDTSKDTDGGAWRKRTQGTSWYNETLNTATRGSRREFPAVAVIVATETDLIIYDGDDPSLPMWFKITGVALGGTRPIGGVFALNGDIAAAQVGGINQNGLIAFNFIHDKVRHYGAVADSCGFANTDGVRGDGNYFDYDWDKSLPLIVNISANDVAMTVLPDAPIDPATGLPVPTIAVATDGGVSVIKDDGTVVDSADTDASYSVDFNDHGSLIYPNRAGQNDVNVVDTYASDGFSGRDYSELSIPATNGAVNIAEAIATKVPEFVILGAVNGGITSVYETPEDKSKGMVAYTTSTYNTGWMNGDIKGAFLADTDDTDLVGSGELVTNGTFDTDTTGWTAAGVDGGTDTTFSWNASGYMDVTRGTGGVSGRPEQGFPTVAGKTYTISVDVVTAQRAFWTVGSSSGGANLINLVVHNGNTTVTKTFVATSSTSYVGFWTDLSATTGIDNVSVKLADADRSVNANPLNVYGTITRIPVATGANLVGYSGFSAANYLEQPYNSALDFGTGDFCVMGWVKASAATRYIFDRADAAYTGGRISLYRASAGNIRATLTGTANLDSGVELNDTWQFVVLKRASGVLYLSVNAGTPATAANTSVLSNATATTRLGLSVGGLFPCGSMALWRISATAESAAGIAKIYNDEKFLFQDGAQATLYGTSDAVTALAYDDDTNLLSVGTSAGRSDFQGLRRVANTTTAVSTFISAGNGMVVEQ